MTATPPLPPEAAREAITPAEDTIVRLGADPTLTRVARGGALNLLGAVTGALGSFLVVVAVSHQYSKADTGAFLAATSLFLIVLAVAELGVDTGLLRFIPGYLLEHRYRTMRLCLQVALRPVYVASVAFGIAMFAAAPYIGNVVASSGEHDAFAQMLRVLAFGLPVAAAYELILANTRAYATMRPSVFIEKFARAVVQPAAVLAVGLAGGGPVALAIAFTAPYLPALAWAILWNARIANRAAGGAAPDTTPPSADLRHEFWQYTTPRALARICQVALQRADVILVAAYKGAAAAAVYGVASRLLVFGQLGVQAVQQVLQPHLSRLFALDDKVSAERVFKTSTAWLMLIGWPVYLTTATAAPLLLAIFPGYSNGETALIILSLTMLIATACGPVDIVLLMAGRSGLSLFNNAAALVVDIAVDIILIPRIGITGAAVGWAAALLVRNVLPLGQVLRVIGMTPMSAGVAWVAVSSVVSFGLLPLVARASVGDGVAVSLAWLAVCIGVYAVLVWRGRRQIGLDAFAGLLRRRRRGQPSQVAQPADEVPAR